MSLSKWAALGVLIVAIGAALNAARQRQAGCTAGECLAPIAPLASPLPPAPHAVRPVELGRSF